MGHIHTQPGQHDSTVTAYIVRTDGGEPRALLHMHRKHHRLLPVGGHVELSETPWQAAAHELREESGYELTDLQILQPPVRLVMTGDEVAQHPYPIFVNTHDISSEHFHSDQAYAFVAQADPRYTPDDGESLDLRWLTLDELNALTSDEIWNNTREVYRFILTQALQGWDTVSTTTFGR